MNRTPFVFIVFLNLVLIKGKDVTPKNDLEMKMLYLVDKWRTGDLDALPYPMPPLDEWRMPPFEGKYNGLGLQMTFSTTGMLITGLNNFTITEMNISEENLEGSAVLNYPFVNMEADNYKLNGRAYVVYKLRGSGRMNVRVRNTKLVFGFRVNNNGSKPVVDDLQLDYEIESLEVCNINFRYFLLYHSWHLLKSVIKCNAVIKLVSSCSKIEVNFCKFSW
ncbi:hypothetical protein O3G_MSEX007708 [Manduca sexta]|uniref:Uncharacterized protein n=1 Tax=Manduca sexta TaxID=7130 RepID=A0A922CNP5_MANSE|nr:hypothetical protein O3G_MSEX007708 [Manduca sexta]